MLYDTTVYWEKGVVRACNQDSLIVLQALTSKGRVLMAALCDGMGGLDLGECASGYLTEELVTWFYDGLLPAIGKKKPLWVIRRCAERKVFQVQGRLQRYADKRNFKMGTTLSMLVLWEKKYLIWHLGDSRIYHLSTQKGSDMAKVRVLTQDHVQGTNMLTKCVGSFGYFRPDFKMGAVRSGEAFLICSDGFWRRIERREIGEVLLPSRMTEGRKERRLREIGEAVMRRGERDNLSAIYIRTEKGRRKKGKGCARNDAKDCES